MKRHVGSSSSTRGRTLGPLHWGHGVLATEPPGKSHHFFFLKQEFVLGNSFLNELTIVTQLLAQLILTAGESVYKMYSHIL